MAVLTLEGFPTMMSGFCLNHSCCTVTVCLLYIEASDYQAAFSFVADWGSVTTEDATQNAALAAILFLAGGLGKDSPHCVITLVGSDPTVRPLVLNRQQATDMLDRRAREVLHEKVLISVCLPTNGSSVHGTLTMLACACASVTETYMGMYFNTSICKQAYEASCV